MGTESVDAGPVAGDAGPAGNDRSAASEHRADTRRPDDDEYPTADEYAADDERLVGGGAPRHVAASGAVSLVRWAASRRAVTAVLAMALLGLLVVVFFPPSCGRSPEVSVLVSGSPSPLPEGLPSGAPTASSSGNPAGASTGSGDVVVHVTGAVRRPGLVRLPDGALVDDAVREAGGLSEDAAPDGVNLAAALEGGQQVRIPARGESAVAAPAPAPAGGGAGGVGRGPQKGRPGEGRDEHPPQVVAGRRPLVLHRDRRVPALHHEAVEQQRDD
ncbi:SLBB domain-containing protein, partial [Rothia sp. AR01]